MFVYMSFLCSVYKMYGLYYKSLYAPPIHLYQTLTLFGVSMYKDSSSSDMCISVTGSSLASILIVRIWIKESFTNWNCDKEI